MRVWLLDHPDGAGRLLALAGTLPPTWTAVVCADAAEALAGAQAKAFDALFCGLRGDPEPGTDILKLVQTLHPEAMRVLLLPEGTGAGEASRFTGAAGVQQVLVEPVDEGDLRRVMRRLMTARGLLADRELRAQLGTIDRLPSPPATYLALRQAIGDASVSISEVGARIARDAGLAARVLRMANSALFSRGIPMNDVQAAVHRLGLDALSQLVLAGEVFGQAGNAADAGKLERRGLLASRLAQRIAPEPRLAALASSAALLADTGLLLPARLLEAPAHPLEAWRGIPRASLLGGCLLALWGLPMELVEAVTYRHVPAKVTERGFGLTGVVHVAAGLAAGTPLDEDYLAQQGVADKLPGWRTLMAETADALAD